MNSPNACIHEVSPYVTLSVLFLDPIKIIGNKTDKCTVSTSIHANYSSCISRMML